MHGAIFEKKRRRRRQKEQQNGHYYLGDALSRPLCIFAVFHMSQNMRPVSTACAQGPGALHIQRLVIISHLRAGRCIHILCTVQGFPLLGCVRLLVLVAPICSKLLLLA